MQIGGIGSGHDSSSHHITNCIHEHGGKKLEAEGAMKSFTGGAQTPVWKTGQEAEGFSLSAWLADPLKNMKKLAGKLWRGGSESGEAVRGNTGSDSAKGEQVMARLAEEEAAKKAGLNTAMNGSANGRGERHTTFQNAQDMLHTPQVAAAATAVRQPDVQNNPYFAAVADTGRERQSLMEKMKVRFESVTSFLAKKFSFSGRNSFQAKQEQPREDMRKRSHYRGEDVDIECVLTDDSYLLDSYDRKGEYSKLSAK